MNNDDVIKHDWYGLNSVEKIETVLDLINNKGYLADDLFNYFDVKTKRVIPDFMNSKGYSKQGHKYVEKANKAPSASTNTNKAVRAANINSVQSEIAIDEELLNNMVSLSKKHNNIVEMLDWFNNREKEAAPEVNIIEVIDTALPIPKVDGETKRTTIRVNENIMANFNSVWKKHYAEYKQHDLLNLALQMFIDKYNK